MEEDAITYTKKVLDVLKSNPETFKLVMISCALKVRKLLHEYLIQKYGHDEGERLWYEAILAIREQEQ